MEIRYAVMQVPLNTSSPTDFWGTVQELFNLSNLDVFLYLILATLFVYIYKTSQDLYTRFKQNSKQEMEELLNRYLEIQVSADRILQEPVDNSKAMLELFHNIKKCYTYIEYQVYLEFEKIIKNQKFSNTEKIERIKSVVDLKVPELLYKKTYSINYDNHWKSPIKHFFTSLQELLIPVVISLGILMGLLIILPIVLIQPNFTEVYVTITAIIVLGMMLYYADDIYKSQGKWFMIPHILMIIFLLLIIGSAGWHTFIFIMLFLLCFVLCSLWIIRKARKNNNLMKSQSSNIEST